MTALVFTAVAVLAVAGVLLAALTHHRQETTMAEHAHEVSEPTVETVDLMLAQLQRDRAVRYWSEGHPDALDGAETWLSSLRDHLANMADQ